MIEESPTTTAKKAIDDSLEPLRSDYLKYTAFSNDKPLFVTGARLHYVYDQYGTELADWASPHLPVGHSHPLVLRAIREHLDYYIDGGSSDEWVARWPTEYAKKLVESFNSEKPLKVLFTSGYEHALSLAQTLSVINGGSGISVSLMYKDGEVLHSEDIQRRVEVLRRSRRLVTVDESRTGFGRTGTMWAQQNAGVEADVTVLGGALGGGLNLGAVVASDSVFNTLKPSDRFVFPKGIALPCAAGAATLEVLNEGVLHNVQRCAEVLDHSLSLMVSQFRSLLVGTGGMGMFRYLQFVDEGRCRDARNKLIERGVITPQPYGNRLVLAPTLISSEFEVKRVADIVTDCFIDLE